MTTAAVMRGWVVLSPPSFVVIMACAGYRIVERERRLDVGSPRIGEREPLLSPEHLELVDAGAKSLVYGSVQSDSPRS
jgi:hypothetical protein